MPEPTTPIPIRCVEIRARAGDTGPGALEVVGARWPGVPMDNSALNGVYLHRDFVVEFLEGMANQLEHQDGFHSLLDAAKYMETVV